MGGEENKCYACTWYTYATGYCNFHKRKVGMHDTCRDFKKKGQKS